jgi:hypothetical protein
MWPVMSFWAMAQESSFTEIRTAVAESSLIPSPRKHMSRAMRRERSGTPSSGPSQPAMKNAGQIPVDFIFVHSRKFTHFLASEMMRSTSYSGSIA